MRLDGRLKASLNAGRFSPRNLSVHQDVFGAAPHDPASWSRRRRDWLRRIDEGLIGRLAGQRLMRTPTIGKSSKTPGESPTGFPRRRRPGAVIYSVFPMFRHDVQMP
jgi:hypothetical protein